MLLAGNCIKDSPLRFTQEKCDTAFVVVPAYLHVWSGEIKFASQDVNCIHYLVFLLASDVVKVEMRGLTVVLENSGEITSTPDSTVE